MKNSRKTLFVFALALMALCCLLAVSVSAKNTNVASADALSAAIADADDGDTITLTASFTGPSETIAVTKNITITAASGQTLTTNATPQFTVTAATLTFAGNLNVTAPMRLVQLEGNEPGLVINLATISNKIETTGSSAHTITLGSTCKNATVEFKQGYVLSNPSSASGAAVLTSSNGSSDDHGTVTINVSGGKIQGGAASGNSGARLFYLYRVNPTITVTGGEILNTSQRIWQCYSGSASLGAKAIVNISGGTFEGRNTIVFQQAIPSTITVTGGHFTFPGTADTTTYGAFYLGAAGCSLNITGGTFDIGGNCGLAQAAAANCTITVAGTAQVTTNTTNTAAHLFKVNGTLTLNIGGNARLIANTASVPVLYLSAAGCVANITGTPYLESNGHNVVHASSNVTVSIAGGTLKANTKNFPIRVNGGTTVAITITGGSLIGTDAAIEVNKALSSLDIKGGTFEAPYGIRLTTAYTGGDVIIEGGTFNTSLCAIYSESTASAPTIKSGATYTDACIAMLASVDVAVPDFEIDYYTADDLNYYTSLDDLLAGAVACIGTYGTGSAVYYPSLSAAITAAEENAVITVFADTNEAVIPFAKSLTINGMNDPTITACLQPSDGTLILSNFTLVYSGTSRVLKTTGSNAVTVEATNVTFISTDNTPIQLAATGGNALTLTDCYVTGANDAASYYAVFLQNVAASAENTITLSGSEFYSRSSTIYIGAPAAITVEDCSFSSRLNPENTTAEVFYFANTAGGSELTIEGENSATGGVILASAAVINVTIGGTGTYASHVAENAPIVISASECSFYVAEGAVISPSSAGVLASVTGGYLFDYTDENYPDMIASDDGRLWFVDSDAQVAYLLANAAARIGSEVYATLAAALDAAQEGDTIELLNNDSLGATATISQNLTICRADGVSKELTITASVRMFSITNGATLTLGEGITFSTSATAGIELKDDNTALIINGAALIASGASGKTVTMTGANTSVTLNGGAISATGTGNADAIITASDVEDKVSGSKMQFTMTAGTLYATRYAFYQRSDMRYDISGGTINSLSYMISQYNSSGTQIPNNTWIYITSLDLTATNLVTTLSKNNVIEVAGLIYHVPAGKTETYFISANDTALVENITATLGAGNDITTTQMILNMRASNKNIATVTGGTYVATNNNPLYLVACKEASFTMTGGSLTYSGDYALLSLRGTEKNTLEITGGSLIAMTDGKAAIQTMNGPFTFSISGNTTVISAVNAKVLDLQTVSTGTIAGGTIRNGAGESYVGVIDASQSLDLTMTGGALQTETSSTHHSGIIMRAADNTVKVTGGSITAGYIGVFANGSASNTTITVSDGVTFTVGTGFYLSATASLTVDGGTFTCSNLVATADSATIEPEITWNGGNAVVRSTAFSIQCPATLTVKGGNITAGGWGLATMGVANAAGATITVSNVNFTSADGSTYTVYAVASGTVNIYGGTFATKAPIYATKEGVINIYGGTYTGSNPEKAVIRASENGEVVVWGGSFTSIAVVGRAEDRQVEEDVFGGILTLNGGRFVTTGEENYAFVKDPESTIDFCGGFTVQGGLGYIDGEDYDDRGYYVESAIEMNAGAQVRLSDTSGIRFVGHMDAYAVDFIESVADENSIRYYTIILPEDMISLLDEVTPEEIMSKLIVTRQYIKVLANDGFVPDGHGGYYIRTALVNIKEANYGRKFAAIVYAEYEIDGHPMIQSSVYTAKRNARSIREVAQVALADTSRTFTEQQLAILNAYAGNNQVATFALLPANVWISKKES